MSDPRIKGDNQWVNESSRSILLVKGKRIAEAVLTTNGWVGRSTVNGQLCSPEPRISRAQAIEDIFEHRNDLLGVTDAS